jgi:hypothetical protein
MSTKWIIGGIITSSVVMCYWKKEYILKSIDENHLFHASAIYAGGYLSKVMLNKMNPHDAKKELENLQKVIDEYPHRYLTQYQREKTTHIIQEGLHFLDFVSEEKPEGKYII